MMSLAAIRVENNVRSDVGDVTALAESIRQYGIIEPLVVTPDGRLLAGHRRLAAARRAGLEQVPVRELNIHDERAAVEVGLIENAQREDLDPLSRAKAYRALIHEHGATVEEVARLVGHGAGHVYQHLQLLDLHPQVQQALLARTISFADARALAPLSPEDQAAVMAEIQAAPKPLSSAVMAEIQAAPKPLSSRQVKKLVHTRRVQRAAAECNSNEAYGDYDALFAAEDRVPTPPANPTDNDALAALSEIIAEMLAVAQGEDQIRGWARRLSRIAEQLQGERSV